MLQTGKLLYSGDVPPPLKCILKDAGCIKVKRSVVHIMKKSKILVWTKKLSSPSELSCYPSGVLVNKLPCANIFARKDRFAESVDAGERFVGRVTPKTFEYPKEKHILLKHECLRFDDLERDNKSVLQFPLIFKPSGGSCGRGIILIKTVSQLASLDSNGIIQDYIVNPLLLEGYKNDFRVYCVITSISPLVCYIHELGLCRMATRLYSDHSCPRRDLTNYSVNKAYIHEECTPSSYKRPMEIALKQLEDSMQLKSGSLMKELYCAVLKVVVCYERTVADVYYNMKAKGFLLLGIDVMFDSAGNAWVLEANTSPSFHCSTKTEKEMKMKVLSDTLKLVGYLPGKKREGKAMILWQKRLLRENVNLGGFTRICPSQMSLPYVSAFSKRALNDEAHKFMSHYM